MATFLGVIFLAVGLANAKNDGDRNLTLYFEILGPILLSFGVVGLIALKCVEERDRKARKNKHRKKEPRSLFTGRMAIHRKNMALKLDPTHVKEDPQFLPSVSGQIDNSLSDSSDTNPKQVPQERICKDALHLGEAQRNS